MALWRCTRARVMDVSEAAQVPLAMRRDALRVYSFARHTTEIDSLAQVTSQNKTSDVLRVLVAEKHRCDPVFVVALLLFHQVKT